jgi:hypothetical protein
MPNASLAIIGTAGRGSDKDKLSADHYKRMVKVSTKLIDHLGFNKKELRVFSGGAAWADHVVVTLGLEGVVAPENVTLYLPCEYDERGFLGYGDKAAKTASTANYYHSVFSKIIGQNSFGQILEVARRGAAVFPGNGNFFTRNTLVAQSVSPDGVLLAFTFGQEGTDQKPWTLRPADRNAMGREGGVKDGGSADTWGKAKCLKYHGLLGSINEQLKLI